MTQVPSHLVGWMIPKGVSADGVLAEGELRCPCGNEELEFHSAGTPNPFQPRVEFAVRAVCGRCGQECLVLDNGLHGWDALCYRRQRAVLGVKERRCRFPFQPWRCRACGAARHRGAIRLTLVPDAKDIALHSLGAIDESQRLDAFTILAIDLTCGACGLAAPEWARCQTEGWELTNPYLPLSMELTVLWDGVPIGRVAVKKRRRKSPTVFGDFIAQPGPAGLPPLLAEARHLVEAWTPTQSEEEEDAGFERYNAIGDEMKMHVRLAELSADVDRFDFARDGVWITLNRIPADFARRHPPRSIRDLVPEPVIKPIAGLPGGDIAFRVGCPCGERACYLLGYFWEGEGPNPEELFVSPLALECPRCGRVSELIDTRQHGHDGEQGCDCNKTGEGPRVRFPCPQCGEVPWAAIAAFDYGGHEADPLDPEARPQDFFGWFTLSGECSQCGKLVRVTDFECS